MIFSKIHEVAEVNPRAKGLALKDNDPVSFVPMAAVSEQSRSVVAPEVRPYGEVSKGYTYFEEGDVIIAKITPCFENGKIALAEGLPHQIAFGSTEYHVVRAGKSVHNRYLFYLLQSPYVLAAGADRMKGAAGQKRVPAEFLKDLEIPLPPLAEQKRIAAILDAADELRTKRRESLAQLDTLLQSTFLDLFGDPVTNPKGWEKLTVGEFAKVKGGKRLPKGEDYADAPTGYRYIRVSDISPNQIDESDLRNLKPETQKKIARYIVESGDVIITIAGTIGLTAAVPDSLDGVNLTENAAKIVPDDKRRVNATYLSYALQMPHAQSQIRSHTGQVTIGKLALFRIEKIEVLLPPEEKQKRFASFVSETESQRRRMTRQLDELGALFSSLQSRAFRGEL